MESPAHGFPAGSRGHTGLREAAKTMTPFPSLGDRIVTGRGAPCDSGPLGKKPRFPRGRLGPWFRKEAFQRVVIPRKRRMP